MTQAHRVIQPPWEQHGQVRLGLRVAREFHKPCDLTLSGRRPLLQNDLAQSPGLLNERTRSFGMTRRWIRSFCTGHTMSISHTVRRHFGSADQPRNPSGAPHPEPQPPAWAARGACEGVAPTTAFLRPLPPTVLAARARVHTQQREPRCGPGDAPLPTVAASRAPPAAHLSQQ